MVERNQGITILPELATLDFEDKHKGLIRQFASPAPVREVSLVAHKNFAKTAVLNALKKSILASLPESIKNTKPRSVIQIKQ